MAASPRTNHIVLYPEGLVRLQRRQMLGNRPRNWARRVRFDLPSEHLEQALLHLRGGGGGYGLYGAAPLERGILSGFRFMKG